MRALLLAITIITLIIGGYSFWWNKVADIALAQVQQWKKDRTAEGYIITHSPLDVSGFPYRVKISIQKISIQEPEENRKAKLALNDFWAVAQPWNVSHLIFGLNGTLESSWIDGESIRNATANASSALGSVTLDQAGKVDTVAMDIKDLIVENINQGPILAERMQIHSRPGNNDSHDTETTLPQKALREYSLRINNVSFDLNKELPLGNEIKKLGLSVLLDNDLKDFGDKMSVTQWRDDGGIIDLQEVNLDWGDSQLTAKGTLALDDEYRPIGAFRAKMSGFNAILDALVANNKLDAKNVKAASFALNMLAKTNKKGTRYLDIPISIQQGTLSLGPLSLLTIDPIFD